jgi:hypothetical protein
VVGAEPVEVALVDRERLRVLERRHRRRPPRSVADERHLAEALTRPAHGENGGVAEGRHDPDRESAAGDEVERVRRIVVVKDDLVAGEPAPARDRDQPPDVGFREPRQQPPLHRSIVRRGSNALKRGGASARAYAARAARWGVKPA